MNGREWYDPEVPDAFASPVLVGKTLIIQLSLHLGDERLVVGPETVHALVQLEPEDSPTKLA